MRDMSSIHFQLPLSPRVSFSLGRRLTRKEALSLGLEDAQRGGRADVLAYSPGLFSLVQSTHNMESSTYIVIPEVHEENFVIFFYLKEMASEIAQSVTEHDLQRIRVELAEIIDSPDFALARSMALSTPLNALRDDRIAFADVDGAYGMTGLSASPSYTLTRFINGELGVCFIEGVNGSTYDQPTMLEDMADHLVFLPKPSSREQGIEMQNMMQKLEDNAGALFSKIDSVHSSDVKPLIVCFASKSGEIEMVAKPSAITISGLSMKEVLSKKLEQNPRLKERLISEVVSSVSDTVKDLISLRCMDFESKYLAIKQAGAESEPIIQINTQVVALPDDIKEVAAYLLSSVLCDADAAMRIINEKKGFGYITEDDEEKIDILSSIPKESFLRIMNYNSLPAAKTLLNDAIGQQNRIDDAPSIKTGLAQPGPS